MSETDLYRIAKAIERSTEALLRAMCVMVERGDSHGLDREGARQIEKILESYTEQERMTLG